MTDFSGGPEIDRGESPGGDAPASVPSAGEPADAERIAGELTAMQRALLSACRKGPLHFVGMSWRAKGGRVHFRHVTVDSLAHRGLLAVDGFRADPTELGRDVLARIEGR